jgi:4-hydroxybenzoate polyprenyltransferase
VRIAAELLRVESWLKNGFIFAGVLFSGRFTDPRSLLITCAVFGLFSFVASAVYIENDIADRESDRRHPTKRTRPIASGAVSIATARLIQIPLLAAGLGLGFWLDANVGMLLAAYVILNVLYTFWLKHVVILDVMTIAISFVLRVLIGCAAIDIVPSQWIMLCAFMLALHLGFGKRRQELILLHDRPDHRRPVLMSYGVQFLDQLMVIVSALTIVCYILFTMSPETVARQGTKNLVYTVPFVIYGLFRYDWLVHQREGGDPTTALLTDPHLIVTVVLWALTAAAILGPGWRGEPLHPEVGGTSLQMREERVSTSRRSVPDVHIHRVHAQKESDALRRLPTIACRQNLVLNFFCETLSARIPCL